MPATTRGNAWRDSADAADTSSLFAFFAREHLRDLCGLVVLETPAPSTTMPDSTKATQAVMRLLLEQMAKALAEPKPKPAIEGEEFVPPPGYLTRVNVKEFERGQEDSDWWRDGGDEDPFIGLRPRPKPRGPRRRR
jgi:hypothetical protein